MNIDGFDDLILMISERMRAVKRGRLGFFTGIDCAAR